MELAFTRRRGPGRTAAGRASCLYPPAPPFAYPLENTRRVENEPVLKPGIGPKVTRLALVALPPTNPAGPVSRRSAQPASMTPGCGTPLLVTRQAPLAA
jgi:hypothetical protein